VFSPEVTITTAQFAFFNCKFDFTTADIVISNTLKYVLFYATNFGEIKD